MSGTISDLGYNWRSFLENPWQSVYLRVLLIINIIGSAYGYYWYWGQLSATTGRLWLFVPDSPLSTTLFAVVLVLSIMGFRSAFLELIAFAGCIKYGVWAALVISDFWAGGGAVRFEEAMLWVSHLGMAAQGFVYLRTLLPEKSPARVSFSHLACREYLCPTPEITGVMLAGLGVWLLLNDYMDYFGGTHPYLYYSGQEHVAGVLAFGLSGVIIAALLYFMNRRLAAVR